VGVARLATDTLIPRARRRRVTQSSLPTTSVISSWFSSWRTSSGGYARPVATCRVCPQNARALKSIGHAHPVQPRNVARSSSSGHHHDHRRTHSAGIGTVLWPAKQSKMWTLCRTGLPSLWQGRLLTMCRRIHSGAQSWLGRVHCPAEGTVRGWVQSLRRRSSQRGRRVAWSGSCCSADCGHTDEGRRLCRTLPEGSRSSETGKFFRMYSSHREVRQQNKAIVCVAY
jgi:hypothetical protein